MKNIGLFLLIFLTCNAKRDNIYDPRNPDKASVGGVIYEPDSLPVSGAIALLTKNGLTVRCDTSNALGEYHFENIDPGIYGIIFRTQYFNDVIFNAESLWAGTRFNAYDIFFTTFHFEDDRIGELAYGFNSAGGEWRVIGDTAGDHSKPQVLCGSAADSGARAVAFFQNPTKALKFNFKMNVKGSSGNNWETGILMWYQNESNYYVVRITSFSIKYCLVNNSVETVLYTKSISFAKDVWHNIETDFTGEALILYVDEVFQFPISLMNIVFSDGMWGVYVLKNNTTSQASVMYDDIYLKIINY